LQKSDKFVDHERNGQCSLIIALHLLLGQY